LDIILNVHILRSHFFSDPKVPVLIQDPAAQARFIEIWLELAQVLGQIPNSRLAYELLNEPVAPQPASWNQMATRLHQSLREIEPERTIVIGT